MGLWEEGRYFSFLNTVIRGLDSGVEGEAFSFFVPWERRETVLIIPIERKNEVRNNLFFPSRFHSIHPPHSYNIHAWTYRCNYNT